MNFRIILPVLGCTIFSAFCGSATGQESSPAMFETGVDALVSTGAGYDAVTGSVRRSIVDLEQVPVPGLKSLFVRRHHATVRELGGTSFHIGFEPLWGMKYYYSYEHDEYIYDFWSASGRQLIAVNWVPWLIQPLSNGVNEQFEQIDNADGTRTVIMIQPNGERIAFQSIAPFSVTPVNPLEFRIIWIDDANGRRTTALHTNGDSFVDKLTDPTGRWISFQGTPNKFGGKVTQATSSDGQWVQYSYNSGNLQVTYSDGTSASYTYSAPNTNSRVLTFNDVRPAGPMPSATYNLVKFYFSPGQFDWVVGSVTHPGTGSLVSSRAVTGWTNNWSPFSVIETRGDGPARTIRVLGTKELDWASDYAGNITDISASDGQLWFATDPRANTTSYHRETNFGNITRITYPGGAYREWTYTSASAPFFVASSRDERGYVTTYDRFPNGIIGQANYPDGSNEGWNSLNSLLQPGIHRFRNGAHENFVHNSSGQLTRHYLPWTTAWTDYIDYTYYPDGHVWEDRVWTVKDPRGNITEYEYDRAFVSGQSVGSPCSGRGLVSKIIHKAPNGTLLDSVEFRYDPRGNKVWEMNELGKITTYTYDDYNRLRTTTDPVGRTTQITYGQTGVGTNLMTHTAAKPGFETSPSGKTTAYTYNANLSVLTVTPGYGTPDAGTTTYGYDSAGNQTSMVDPMNRTTTFEYDNRNRRTKETAPLGRITQWQYDPASNVTKVTNPDATFTEKTYDTMNRVLTSKDEMSRITTYTYLPSGQVNTITDPRGSTHQQLYDAYDRLKERKYPLPGGGGYGTNERWEYDPAGNVSAYYNRSNQKQNFTYDDRNRETRRYWDGGVGVGPDVQTGYDARSRVLWKTNGNGRLDYTYNDADEVTQDMQTVTGGPTVHLNPSYNLDGQRSSVWTSAGTWLGYAYNGRRALSEIQQWGGAPITWAAYSYNAAGQRRFRTHYNGSVSDYNYDAAGRSNYLHTYKSGGQWILKQTTGKDLRDRRTWTVRDDNYGDAYSYQPDSQLTQYRNNIWRPDLYPANPASWTDTFAYDTGGNRTSWNENGAVKNYTTDALNQYTAVTGATIAHNDGRGNLTQWKEWTYAYDAENRLTSASKTGYIVTFSYDPAGRLVKVNRNGTSEYRYYDGTQVFLRTQANGAWIDFTIWGPRPDEVVSRWAPANGWLFYHQDFSGGTAAITDMGQSVVERYLYDAYGRELLYNGSWQPIVSSPTSNPWTFTGQEFLADIGLNNYKNRFYHSELGRFIQNDPIRFNGGDLNLYRYVGNSPVNGIDPTGLSALHKDEDDRAKEAKDEATLVATFNVGIEEGVSDPFVADKAEQALQALVDNYANEYDVPTIQIDMFETLGRVPHPKSGEWSNSPEGAKEAKAALSDVTAKGHQGKLAIIIASSPIKGSSDGTRGFGAARIGGGVVAESVHPNAAGHELGHAMGLPHKFNDPKNLMSPALVRIGAKIDSDFYNALRSYARPVNK